MATKPLFNTTTGGTVKDSDVMAYKETGAAGDPTRNHLFSVMKTFFQGSEVLANTVYKDRVKTKVLWTGPLSVVSTPTSLDGAEKFSDWDLFSFEVNLSSDTASGARTVQTVPVSFADFGTDIEFYTDLGKFSVETLSDTTFQIKTKTTSVGNIVRILGISL